VVARVGGTATRSTAWVSDSAISVRPATGSAAGAAVVATLAMLQVFFLFFITLEPRVE